MSQGKKAKVTSFGGGVCSELRTVASGGMTRSLFAFCSQKNLDGCRDLDDLGCFRSSTPAVNPWGRWVTCLGEWNWAAFLSCTLGRSGGRNGFR